MMLASGADSSYLASSDSDSGSADSFLATTTSSDSATSSINFKPLATVTLLVTNRPVALFSKPANVFLQGQVYAGFSLELEYIQAGAQFPSLPSFFLSFHSFLASPRHP